MTFDGQLYGVPYSVENIAPFRNTDMIDLPGDDGRPRRGRVAQVGKDGVTNPMALQVGQAGDAYHIYPLFSSGGGVFFEPNANGDPDPTKVSRRLGRLHRGGRAHRLDRREGRQGPEAPRSTTRTRSRSSPTKKTPFLVSGPWAVADIKKGGVNYDICPIPGWKGKDTAGPFIGVNGFYLASKGKNKTLAQDFATSFLTTQGRPGRALRRRSRAARR